jgi:RsbT co-antagonist protein rsbRD N-terminal domain
MLKDLLVNKKSSIVDSWIQLIVETYPSKTSNFLKSQKNRFGNPVGYAISKSAQNIFEEIINGRDINRVKAFLADIIKIRAVQDFSPSQATGFIFSLKKVIRKELGHEVIEGKILSDIADIESYIDDIALIAFDLYMDAREKLFKIRISEIKSQLAYNKGMTE